MNAPEDIPDNDLPGVWSHSDFLGGPPEEVRGPNWEPFLADDIQPYVDVVDSYLDELITHEQTYDAVLRGEVVCPGPPNAHEALEEPCVWCGAST